MHARADLCPMRIFLVGPMCSGKTTVGRALAARLGFPHLDTDRLIEARIGPITPWVLREGEEAFRHEERAVLLDVVAGPGAVVSCGGGTPIAFDNMDRILEAGMVVHLDVPLPELIDRCQRKGIDRPLLFGLGREALAARVEALWRTRRPVYQRAHVTVDAGGSPAAIVEAIAGAVLDQER